MINPILRTLNTNNHTIVAPKNYKICIKPSLPENQQNFIAHNGIQFTLLPCVHFNRVNFLTNSIVFEFSAGPFDVYIRQRVGWADLLFRIHILRQRSLPFVRY